MLCQNARRLPVCPQCRACDPGPDLGLTVLIKEEGSFTPFLPHIGPLWAETELHVMLFYEMSRPQRKGLGSLPGVATPAAAQGASFTAQCKFLCFHRGLPRILPALKNRSISTPFTFSLCSLRKMQTRKFKLHFYMKGETFFPSKRGMWRETERFLPPSRAKSKIWDFHKGMTLRN